MKEIHPNREAWAVEAEEAAKKVRHRAGQLANPKLSGVARVVAQLFDGRAAALRTSEPVELVLSDGRHVLTYVDGTFDLIPEG